MLFFLFRLSLRTNIHLRYRTPVSSAFIGIIPHIKSIGKPVLSHSPHSLPDNKYRTDTASTNRLNVIEPHLLCTNLLVSISFSAFIHQHSLCMCLRSGLSSFIHFPNFPFFYPQMRVHALACVCVRVRACKIKSFIDSIHKCVCIH